MKRLFKKPKMSATQFWVGVWCMVYGGLALAQTAGGSMPWDGPLCGFANALRGPAALAISTVAFFAAGASFLWGEEIAGMSKKLVTIVMGVTVLIGGAGLVGWIAAKMGAAGAAC
ncbi:TrbC/VirB2 family protein [Undibacterium arcticum]|uniref:TrbC/VirB2 family protein n=1 Tax=Undibacterium arcticum TaxID=1762892 RepID=A0ABV7F753_9BURK